MQQLFKSIRPILGMTVLTATLLLSACGSGETKTDATNADSMTVQPATPMEDTAMKPRTVPADSLPPKDDSAGARPDGIQTNQQ